MRIISGTYQIVNLINNKKYVGSSKNIIRRWFIHKSALKNNRHHCVYLQRSWNKHGEATFKFEILKALDHPTEEQLFAEELIAIKELLPEYNVGAVGGGDNLTKNPNRENIIRRMTESLRQRVSEMSECERQERWGRPGDKNPNWKGGRTFCECGTRITSASNTCTSCRDRNGTKNSFYGKHHSTEFKKRLSEKRKGTIPTNIRSVTIEGVTYPSVAGAARQLGVCNATIIFRIKSKNWDYNYTATSPLIAG